MVVMEKTRDASVFMFVFGFSELVHLPWLQRESVARAHVDSGCVHHRRHRREFVCQNK